MRRIKKYFNAAFLAGITLIMIFFAGCSPKTSDNVAFGDGETIKRQSIAMLSKQGYSEDNITHLFQLLEQLNEPVGLGLEQVVEKGTYIETYDLPGINSYQEEYLWFKTDTGQLYYSYIDKEYSVVLFICKGNLSDGAYIWKTYQ